MKSPEPRIAQLDALRGLAALAVVLYHYTTRYDQLFGHTGAPAFHVPWGEYGVDVFFILSGLLIFRSLDRAPTALQFAVGRFARLYPAYWAAAATTFAVVGLFGLPGQEVSGREAVLNATMLQQLCGARSIDGAYWSLQVELFFYAGMLVLHRAGAFRDGKRVYATVALWLLAALAYHGAAGPYGLAHEGSLRALNKLQLLFSLRYAHLFALGVLLCQRERSLAGGSLPRSAESSTWGFWLLVAACCAIQGMVDSWQAALLIAAAVLVVQAAARGGVRFLAWRPLTLLGAISYALYLVHQNVGYVVIRELESRGAAPMLAIVTAAAISLVLAAGLTLGVERPAQRRIKRSFVRAPRREAAASAPAPRSAVSG